MIFHENRLPADDYHEISSLICFFFLKNSKIWNCCLLQIIRGALRVKREQQHQQKKPKQSSIDYILYG